jgi:laminin alpha 3/5
MTTRILFFLISVQVCIQYVNTVILTPPYFNLVTNKPAYATSTCGEDVNEPELYCKLTGASAADRETLGNTKIIQGQYCDYCDPSDPDKTHSASNAIDGTDRWWQSPPLSRSLDYNMVNFTIDLRQEFHVAFIYIKMGNSPRPGIWALERSTDYGKTYAPWQYFADTPSDCFNTFSADASKRIENDDDILCTTEYSKVLPVEGGEILVSLVNNRPSSKNFSNSDVLQQWTRATNVRLRLIRTKNLLGHLMAVREKDNSVTRRYFYSIRDISIGGRCVCNGHAQDCEASDPDDQDKLVCNCQHNTCGDQCQECCPGFVQKKWRQNRENNEYQCEPCQCHGHSDSCHYDADVDAKSHSLDIHGIYAGGGVCDDCQHNTMGINCDKCKDGYYLPTGVSINETDACRRCPCYDAYSTGSCEQGTGKCECKKQYVGDQCDNCADGFYDW